MNVKTLFYDSQQRGNILGTDYKPRSQDPREKNIDILERHLIRCS